MVFLTIYRVTGSRVEGNNASRKFRAHRNTLSEER